MKKIVFLVLGLEFLAVFSNLSNRIGFISFLIIISIKKMSILCALRGGHVLAKQYGLCHKVVSSLHGPE